MRLIGMPTHRQFGSLAVLVAGALVFISTTREGERRVVAEDKVGELATIEALWDESPRDPSHILRLALAYLKADAPGAAISLIEHSPEALEQLPALGHAYGRALVFQGRNHDALIAEKKVAAQCAEAIESSLLSKACDVSLYVSALRRAELLEELVRVGVEDTATEKDAAALAYFNVNRQVRVGIQ